MGSFGNRHLEIGCPATTCSYMGKSTYKPYPTSPSAKLKSYKIPYLLQITAGWPQRGRSPPAAPRDGGCDPPREGWKGSPPSEKPLESRIQLFGITSSISRENRVQGKLPPSAFAAINRVQDWMLSAMLNAVISAQSPSGIATVTVLLLESYLQSIKDF